jgi:Trk K+ transport system NAD-binding subunit
VVLAVWREGSAQKLKIDEILLQEDDLLLVQGPHDQVLHLQELPEFQAAESATPHGYQLQDRLMVVRIPADSVLEGKTLAESRLAESFGLTLLGIVRAGQTHLMPGPDERLQADDTLLVKGLIEDLLTVRGLRELLVEPQIETTLEALETERIGLMEAALAPRTTLAGKTLRQLHFREKYGLSVLAIYREGRAYRSNLSELPLRFGDALLLFGLRDKMRVLASEPDFLLLAQEINEPPLLHKSPFAAIIMASVVASVLFGWLPISVAAVAGATLMVLTGCLDMEEAYRSIDWRAVFLIAGMLPLGIAMETSGAASFLAEGVVSGIGGLGPLALIAGLFVMTTIASQFMPNAVVTVLMAPIAITTAQNLSLSPYSLLMAVAIAASASFLSPVGHAANVLVMGPGGYRFTDYIKVGFPLTLLILAVVLLILPLVWPLA